MIEELLTRGNQYFSIIRGASLRYLLLAVGTYYLSVLIYSLRWKLVLKGMGRNISYWELVKAVLASIFMNNITPLSRSGGEALRVVWISKKANVPAGLSTVSIIYERLLEAVPVLILMLLGLAYFSSETIDVLVILGVIVVSLIWIKWETFVSFSLRIFKTNLTYDELSKIRELKKQHSLNLLGILLSSAVWILDVLRLKLIALTLGLRVSFVLLIVISIANLLFGMIAVTPGGVGIIEGGLVGTMTFFGIPTLLAVSMTLLERFVSYVLSTAVGFIVLVGSGGSEIWKALRSQ